MTKLIFHTESYRKDIDALRGIAVLLVLAYHAYPNYYKGGFIGVDIFFVISGYLISKIIINDLKNNRFSFVVFYVRRINRIFPALLLVLFVTLIIGSLYLVPEDYTKIGKHIFAGSIFLSNQVSLSEFGYFQEASEQKPLLHLWSLSIEEQFYIIWPIILYIFWKKKLNIYALILVTFFFSFWINIYRSSYDQSFAFFTLQCRAWELIAGASLVYFEKYDNKLVHCIKNISSNLILFLLILASILINKNLVYPNWWALIPVLLTMIILLNNNNLKYTSCILNNRVLVFIGLISYPLYLWHWVLLSLNSLINSNNASDLSRPFILLASIFLSWVTYKFLELPIRKYQNTRITAVILLGLMILTSTLAIYIYKSEQIFNSSIKVKLIGNNAIQQCAEEFKINELCIFGNIKSDKVILIYGDSHAEHLTAAINDYFGKQYKIIFSFYPSCFFSNLSFIKFNPPECRNFINLVSSLKGNKIDVLIRSQRWHGYPLLNNDQEFDLAINDAISAFDLQPLKTIIIGSTPNIDIMCEKRNFYFPQKFNDSTCKQNIDILNENKRFYLRTNDLNFGHNVYFIYPYKYFCTNDACSPINNNTLYFGDAHHLTKEGASLLMPEIYRIIHNN